MSLYVKLLRNGFLTLFVTTFANKIKSITSFLLPISIEGLIVSLKTAMRFKKDMVCRLLKTRTHTQYGVHTCYEYTVKWTNFKNVHKIKNQNYCHADALIINVHVIANNLY